MPALELQPLSLGTSSFAALRAKEQIYVDKTDLIASLINEGDKFFLARPERFGKSLLLSTIESLFRFGLRDFRGLSIEKSWNEGKYCVVRLNFSLMVPVASEAEFRARLNQELLSVMQLQGLKSPVDAGEDGLRAFFAWLYVQPAVSVVLLIDDYDAPFITHTDDERLLDGIQRQLSLFYARIKSLDHALRFLFLIGKAESQKTGVFSELNNLEDISRLPQYSTLLGFTDEEILEWFHPYLERSACILGSTAPIVVDELSRRYGGYAFDRSEGIHVCQPWSVINFLNCPQKGFL